MSSILNQWQVLTKLRKELERREQREYFKCRKFGHLVYNCRNRVEGEKRKLIPKNKFEVLASQVMRYRIREEVKVQRQEKEEEEVKCFRCWRVEHYKWKCPNIVAEKERKEEEVVYIARLQKTQQKRRPVHSIQEKVQKYCEERSMPPESTLLLERGWLTEEIVITYIDYRRYMSQTSFGP